MFIRAIVILLLSVAGLAAAAPSPAAAPEAKGVAIDVTYSGAWYDVTHAGEGFLLEILDATTALVYWFTYDRQGNQAWILAVGTINGNTITFGDALLPSGARFGANFDPADVVLQSWGSLTMSFTDCNTGAMSYSGLYGSGSQQLVRLTAIDGLPCGGSSKVLNGSLTGAFYDPLRSGEGFLIDIIGPDTGLVYWFTFDNDGNPMWVFGVGTVIDNRLVVTTANTTSGGRFGPNFDPGEVQLTEFGPLVFAFDGTGSGGAMAWSGPPAFGDGGMDLVRLTQLAGVPVTFDAPRHRVTTRLDAGTNQLLDGDVNDPNVSEIANGGASTAQVLPPVFRLVGFATAAPLGADAGHFAARDDLFDVYRVPLRGGDVVALDIGDHDAGDPERNDLDLVLFNVNDTTNPVDAAQSIAAVEAVRAPADGEYFVVVNAFAGASTYTLLTQSGGGAASKALGRMGMTRSLVAGEAIVTVSPNEQGRAKATLDRLQAKVKAGAEDRELLVALNLSKSRAKRQREQFAAAGFDMDDSAVWQTVLAIKSLDAQPGITADPNYWRQALAMPSDPAYSAQWHYPQIRLPAAWDITTGDPNLVVSVIDTGIARHPDLNQNIDYSLGIDTISDVVNAVDGDGIDADADDPGDFSNPDGSGSFHGLHVAGTVAADTNNAGAAGVAWRATIMPVRTLGRQGGSDFDIIQGYRWSAGLANETGALPTRRAEIINMSLGGPGANSAMQQAINQARAAGVFTIAAAGNDNSGEPFYPASYDNVVSVSATTIADQKAPYSNFGPTVDIAAPGGDTQADLNGDGLADGVLSLLIDNSPGRFDPILEFYQGTSMAAPHVAGVVALMKSVYPGLSPEELDQAIRSGQITVDLAGNGATVRDNQFGWGRIDALAAVQWAQAQVGGGGNAPQALLSVSPAMLVFDAATDTADFTLSNAGSGSLSVTDFATDVPWVTDLFTLDTDAGGLGSYRLQVDRQGLAAGRYSGNLQVSSSAGDVILRLTLDAGSVVVASDIGFVYVLLVDPLTGGTLGQVTASSVGTALNFNNVLTGEYILAAGTDLDNDGLICDEGELCGAFPSFGEARRLSVRGNVTYAPLPLAIAAPFAVDGAGAKAAVDTGYRRLK